MDSESEWVYDRMRLYKLMVAHPGLSSLRLAEAVGRSARWVRKWVARFKAAEQADMRLFASQSRAPKRRPRQVGEMVKDGICQLRQALSEQYHRPAGALLIRAYLLQDEVVKALDGFVPRSSRTITRILRERGYIRTRPTPTHMPLALCAPMDEWEMDFCEVHLADGRFEFFLVVDRGTSRVVYVEGSEGYRGESALLAVYRLFEHSGLPKRLRFDRDPRFVWSWSADSYPAPLVRLLHVLGVEPVICPPRRPDRKPYVERCVCTFKHEWLDRFSLHSLADCHEALERFPHYHNAQRVHLGRACHGQTPDAAFPDLPRLPALPDRVQPNAWLTSQHGRAFRRHVQANGTLQVDKHSYYVGQALAKRAALLCLDAQQRCLRVTVEGHATPLVLPLKGVYPEQLALHDFLNRLQDEALTIARHRQLLWMQSPEVA